MENARDDPRERYRNKRSRLDRAVEAGEVESADANAIRGVLDALDPERPGKMFRTEKNGTKTLAPKTLANYTTRLRMAAQAADAPLLDLSTERVNALMGDMKTGDAPVGPDDGYATGTVGQYQSALIAFYRHHDGHDVDPDSIHVFAPEDTSVDERDMFTVDEIQAMRDAIDSPRERCLFELLAFTGQRIRVIQTLRIKDIDLDKGVLYINEEEAGLKGAQGKRPLLGAEAYVRRWVEYHPTGEPGDYLITPKPTGGGNPGTMLSQDTIRYHLRKIANKADVEKDVHPHIFRHYFTTIAKRDYSLDDAYIKKLRGDAPGSNVMQTTYRHLSDSDAVEHAEAKFEGREPETEHSLTPKTCPTCGEILDPEAKACENCGTVFAMDAVEAVETMAEEEKEQAESPAEFGEAELVAALLEKNPELAEDLDL